MQISDYKVVSADTVEEMQTKVQTLIGEGWQPVGSAQLNPTTRYPGQLNRGIVTFVQTLVKYSD